MNKISKKILAFVFVIAIFASISITSLAMEDKSEAQVDEKADIQVNDVLLAPGPVKPPHPHSHVSGDPVEENRVEATCKEEGSYDSVEYCQICHKEMSRTPMTIDKIDHTPGAEVEENRVEATCTEEGLYDLVVCCTKCGDEMSRTTVTIDKVDHTPGEAVKENEVEATCTEDGSYDLVVYCTECEEELSRTTETIDALGHTIVKDEAVEPTDTETGLTEGSHCSLCGETIVEQEEIPAKGQKDIPTKPEKNDVSPIIVVPIVNNDTAKTPQDTGTVIVDDTPLTGVEDFTPWVIASATSFMVVLIFAFVIPRQKISYMY